MFNDGLQELIGARKSTEPQGLMGLIDAASVLNRPSQMTGPQQAEEGLAGMLTGAPQEPTLPGMLETAPDEVQSQFGQLVEQFGPPPESVVRDIATLQSQQSSGGGMFDAYSESNQGNLKMAMLVDIIGKLGGRDVGAMKTMMPLAENARKLRLQGEENAAYDKIVSKFTPQQQKFLKALPISMRPMAMKQLLEQQFAVKGREGPLVTVGGQNSPLAIAEGKAFVLAKQNMSAGRDDARNRLRPQQVMRSLLAQKDADGNPVLKTGAFQALTLPMKQMWNSMVDSVATPELAASLQAGSTSYEEIFQSNEKAAALISAALMKGNLSEKELQFSQDIQAMLAKTRGANIILTELTIMREQARVSEADHMEDWELDLDPIKWMRSDGSEDVKQLHSLWKKELRRYRANDAQQLNDAFMKDLWTNKLGLKEMSEGGYREYDEFDQKVGESEDDYEARLKAMSVEQ